MKKIKCSKCKNEVFISINNYENHLKNVHNILIEQFDIREYIKNEKNNNSNNKVVKERKEKEIKVIETKKSETIRIAEISKKMKISHQFVIEILKLHFSYKILNIDLNSKVDISYLEIVKREINKRNSKNVIFEGLNENKFIEIKKILKNKNESLESFFTDKEAIELCKRMSDSIIRKVANSVELFKNLDEQNEVLFKIHKLAMKALEYYGGYMLTFITNTNILKNKNEKIKVYNGKIKLTSNIESTFPNIHFKIKEERYFLRFNRINEKIFNSYQFTIYNKKNNPIYGLNKERKLIINFENRLPYINMFVDLQYQHNPKIYFGYDNSQCDICGRELTDAISIKYGRGPNCRYYNPL